MMSDTIRQPDWQAPDGAIKLYCGDCLEILPGLEAGLVDAVVTDPPYEITATGGGIGAQRAYLSDIEGFTDCGFDYSILAKFPNWMVFGTLRQVPKLIAATGERRWMLLTWNKPNPTPLCGGNYLPDTEYIIHAWSRGGLHGEYADKSRFFIYPATQGKTHPNEKPLPLMAKCVSTAAAVGATILDPFMGSGTTGVACIRTGRKFIGIELERKYFDIAVKRIQQALEDQALFAHVQDKTETQGSLLDDPAA
jgi:DNA modification methylase